MTPRTFLNDCRGVSAIEFAIVAPVFMAFLIGVIQVALWGWSGFAMQHAVEAASRCASINPTECADAATIRSRAAKGALGLPVVASDFTYTKEACGHRVAGRFSRFNFVSGFGLTGYTAQTAACFPAAL